MELFIQKCVRRKYRFSCELQSHGEVGSLCLRDQKQALEQAPHRPAAHSALRPCGPQRSCTQHESVCVGQLLLGIRHVLSVDPTFQKAAFPFPSRYQLQIASWLEVDLGAHFLFSVLGFVWLELEQALSMSVTT